MTMALRLPHIPPEVAAAERTLKAAYADAMPTREAKAARVLLYLVTFAIGALLGWTLVGLGVVSAAEKDFWRAGTTAVAVLSGFMVATMVFTGKIEAAKSLSMVELRAVAAKVNHLLLYQFGTLANHLACILAMFLLPSVAAKFPVFGAAGAVACLGLFFVSVVRSIFVPLQVIELHRFTHAALLRDKREETGKEAGRM